jgi:hypothetical protein
MSLQLSGAFKEELFTNLQIRMPIVVIGGGLTATDTACEAQAYYFTQIKKFSDKFYKIGKEKIWPLLNEEEKEIAEEFLNQKNFPPVKILYRKKIQDSPAYRLNHPELAKAFGEGIEFIENVTPLEAELDKFGHVKNLKCANGKSFECKTILIAAGTNPNLSPALEDGLDFEVWLNFFNHGTLILNVKEEGLESRLLDLMKRNVINDFFFLDQSFPHLVKWANFGETRSAVRVSEFESIDTAISLSGKVDWVWVDCFSHFPLNKNEALRLKDSGFKLCLVSPELHGVKADEVIKQFIATIKANAINPNAVCTKRPDLWEAYF